MGPSPGYFLITKPWVWHMARAQQILIGDVNALLLQCEKRVRVRGKAGSIRSVWSLPGSSHHLVAAPTGHCQYVVTLSLTGSGWCGIAARW